MRHRKIFFSIVILFLCNFRVSYAQEAAQEIIQASRSASIDYKLAWPGILPDHPLYKLKVLRDKITEKLIANKIKKIEYDLLMADKTIYASKLLFEKGSIPLAKETALKGEHYYTILVSDYKWAFWYREKIPQDLDDRIKIAALKHQEVFASMSKNLKSEDKKTFEITAEFSKRNYLEMQRVKNERLHPQK